MTSILHKKNNGLLLRVFYTFLLLFINFVQIHARASFYDGRDGLNSNDIRCISKDNRGFVWLGTNSGLNIFDGYTFSKIQGILSNKSISQLVNNAQTNELYVGTFTGMFRVNLSNLITTKIIYKGPEKRDYSLYNTQSVCVNNANNQIYFSLAKKRIAHVSGNQFEIIGVLPDSTASIKEMIGIDKEHLIVNTGKLYLFNIKTKTFVVIDSTTFHDEILSISKVQDALVICDMEANTFLASAKSIVQNPQTSYAKTIQKFPNRPSKAFFKGNELYYLSENYSFLIYNLNTGVTTNMSQKFPELFEGKVFYSLFVDENDLIWIGTNKGLIKVENRPEIFAKELSNNPERVSTRELYEDTNGDIYVCSYNGLWKKPKQKNTWERYEYSNSSEAKNVADVYTNYIHPLTMIPDNNSDYFYVGMDASVLLRFNKITKVYQKTGMRYENDADQLSNISDLATDKNGNIWMAGTNGLFIYDPKLRTARRYKGQNVFLSNIRIRQLFSDITHNLMYIATTKGLYVIEVDKGLLKHLGTQSTPALSHDDIMYVGKYKNGAIWLGTNGGGVNVLSPNLNEVTYIRRQDGLSNEIVYSIIPENENIYWIATFNGLDRYQKDKNTFTNFFEEDGVSSNEFNQNSFLRTNDKRFYFGSINGITTFVPHTFAPPKPFHIYFAGISKWDQATQSIKLFLDDLATGTTISRDPSDQLIELHFSCSDYLDPQRNSYSYRIKEISENWISLEDRHSMNIGGLPSGHFTLEVKAINAKGGSSSNILLYYLDIKQPFYKTWWFLLLILCLIGVGFYSAYLIKYQNFKKILHLRMKISSNLHDEVGSLLTRITMFSDNLRYSKNSEEQRNIKLEKIANLSRNAVASMSDVLWTIDSRNDFAGNLLDRMREHAEEMLFPLGIDINFVLSVTDLKKHINSDTRGEIYLIFKEAINNIVKHSTASKVEIYYSMQDSRFHLKISNNGVSAAVSEISTGQGMGNMQMRAKKIGATVSMKSDEETFTVELKK